MRIIAASVLSVGAVACTPADDPNRIDISLIGAAPKLGDPDRELLDASRSVLMRETAMGLVAFDASGQIEPALAESWIVTDDGRSVVFRIHRLKWPDGREVTGQDVAVSLNRAIANNSENRFKHLLTAIDAVVGMTGRVVEIRLKTPRPNLLQLLAQPELGIRRNGVGLGPWRIARRQGNALVLHPTPDALAENLNDTLPDAREIHLAGGQASLAVARFLHGRSDLVLGGTIADWPIAEAARAGGSDRIRRDPVDGLFGLEILSAAPFLKERSLREALAMAIDRSAIGDALSLPRWTPTERLLPTQLDSGQPPVAPIWSNISLDERRALARQRVSAWTKARGAIAPVRVALSEGAGMRILFARIAADWRVIGLRAVAIRLGDSRADLRLIDEVAPNNSANWYLTRTGCDYNRNCSIVGDLALVESRAAPTLGQRSAALARADAAFAEYAGYIPIGKPLRWSFVSSALVRYRDNAFGAHPFAQLRIPAKS